MPKPKWEDTEPVETPKWEDTTDPGESLGTQAMKVAGKVIDYPGGIVRAGLGSAVGALGGPKTVTLDDLKNALDPTTTKRAPGMGEMMGRAGVGAGPSLSSVLPIYAKKGSMHSMIQPEEGGAFDPTLRGAAGFAGDMLTDPISHGYAGKALAGLGKVGAAAGELADTVSRPISKVGAGTAEGMYMNSIRPVIQAGERYGNPNVGKTMLKEGIWGSPPAIQKGMEASAGKFKAGRDAILQAADQSGAAASKDEALTPMFNQLQQLIKDQRITPDQGSKILSDLTLAKQSGGDTVPSMLMSQWKTDTAHALPGSTWDELSKSTPSLANQVKETARSGYQKATESAVGRAAGPEAQASLIAQNKQLGDLINPHVEGAAATMAGKYERAPLFSKEDLYSSLLGMGAFNAGGLSTSHTLEGGLAGLLAKKMINATQATSTRSGLGVAGSRALRSSAVSYPLDAAARQTAIREFSPYHDEDTFVGHNGKSTFVPGR